MFNSTVYAYSSTVKLLGKLKINNKSTSFKKYGKPCSKKIMRQFENSLTHSAQKIQILHGCEKYKYRHFKQKGYVNKFQRNNVTKH